MSAKASEERAADAMPAEAPPVRKKTSAWGRFWRNYGLAILFIIAMTLIQSCQIKIIAMINRIASP